VAVADRSRFLQALNAAVVAVKRGGWRRGEQPQWGTTGSYALDCSRSAPMSLTP